jgi:uncharacterized membrane protein
MSGKLLAIAQLITKTNQIFLGIEGVLFGVVVFSSLLIYIQHRSRKASRIL